MNVLLFGATGMVGQGALHECLRDDRVKSVIAVVRAPLGVRHPKLRVVVHPDFMDFSSLGGEFSAVDACFYCIGVTSMGTAKVDYRRITHDYAIAAARALPQTPSVTFVFVSAEGADSTEQGPLEWARVKGRAENELLAMPFRTYVLRPAYIQPLHGATSRTAVYRWLYAGFSWLYPLLLWLAPKHVTTTENIGRAMLALASRREVGGGILHSPEINREAAGRGSFNA